MAITGEPDGAPTKVGVAVVDVLTGLNAAAAILAALYRRAATGAGELIHVPLLDSALAALVNVAQNALVTGEEPARYGNAHASVVPYQPFHAADGWIAVAAANDGLFRRLCEALGRPGIADDPRFATNAARVRHRSALLAELEPVFESRTADEWLEQLLAAGVPVGKIRGVREALRTSGATTTVSHPTAGDLELVAPPFSLLDAAVRPPAPPPLLGEHTAAVLAELGVSEERLAELERQGVILAGAGGSGTLDVDADRDA